MNFNEEEFRKLRRKVETAKTEAEQAKGAMNQLKVELKKEFNCETLEEAKKKLAQMKKEEAEAEALLQKKMDRYQKKWNR